MPVSNTRAAPAFPGIPLLWHYIRPPNRVNLSTCCSSPETLIRFSRFRFLCAAIAEATAGQSKPCSPVFITISASRTTLSPSFDSHQNGLRRDAIPFSRGPLRHRRQSSSNFGRLHLVQSTTSVSPVPLYARHRMLHVLLISSPKSSFSLSRRDAITTVLLRRRPSSPHRRSECSPAMPSSSL